MEKCQTRADDILNETLRKKASVPVTEGFINKDTPFPSVSKLFSGRCHAKKKKKQKMCHVSEPWNLIVPFRNLVTHCRVLPFGDKDGKYQIVR